MSMPIRTLQQVLTPPSANPRTCDLRHDVLRVHGQRGVDAGVDPSRCNVDRSFHLSEQADTHHLVGRNR